MSKITNLSEPWSNNHSGEEVEDFLKEELATTYAKIAAINNSPIVLVSSLSGVSDPLADTVYRLYNGTSYTDYMYYNSQWVEMAVHDVAGFQPQTSYYICGTASATAAKVIDATSNPNNSHLSAYVLTLGGHFKVKMNNVNTVANATLKVGSAAAKALYYNGARASATNSWSAGEVIFVYYDGTNYQSYSSNDKINSYLYGDVRTLSIGKTYKNGEPVISSDKKFLRITKDILGMSLTEAIKSGDLRIYNNVTYRSGRAVNAYSSSTNYSSATAESPIYAIGCPTKFSLTVNSSIIVSFGDGVEELGGAVQLTSGFSSTIIATEIYNLLSSLENSGWTFTNSDEGKITAVPETTGDYSSYTLSMGSATGIGCTAEYNTDGNENTTSIVFTISVAESIITSTFNGTDVNIDISALTVETTLASAIATEIYTAFNRTSRWNISNDGNIIVAECTSTGNNSSVAFNISENIFGITGVLETICVGSDNASYYDGTVWNVISAISNYASTVVWSSDGINEAWLIANATSQNSVTLDIAQNVAKTDAYLYGDLKTLALGQTYTLGEPVKTDDKQLLYMLKTVSEMNVTDEVAANNFKAIKSGTHIGTYQSLKNIEAYTDITYTEGSYAIGSPAGAVIQVTVDSETIAELEESTTISVTIAGIEISIDVDSTMDAVAVATAIYTEFGTKAEWKLINNNDGTLTLISKVAKTTAPTISSNTGSTGVTIAFSGGSAYAGSNVLSKYYEGTWNTVTLNEFAADSSEVLDTTKVWLKLSFNALKAKLTKQDSVAYEASNTPKNITGGNSDLSICDENGNVLIKFKDGEVETKRFKSKDISIIKDSRSLPPLKITDEQGNVLVIFDKGHIKTKNFDSSNIVKNTALTGKTLSALGDSISTFKNHTGTGNPFYPKGDVQTEQQTWWGVLKTICGIVEYRINAIGASTISRHLTSQVPISDSSRFSQLFSNGGSGSVPDFIIVLGGINDWNSGAALGSYEDDFSSPTTAFIPSVRYLMKNLQVTYPASKIFFCTPVRSWYGTLSTYYPPTKGGKSLEDYVNAIIKCGSLHGVPIIDLYNNLHIDEGNMDNMLIDKLHPKYAGNIAIATYIRHELEKYV